MRMELDGQEHFEFSAERPDYLAPCGLDVLTPGKGQAIVGRVIVDRAIGIGLHWTGSVCRPHRKSACPHCKAGSTIQWSSHLLVRPENSSASVAILRFGTMGHEDCVKYFEERGTLLGALVKAERSNHSKFAPVRIIFSRQPHEDVVVWGEKLEKILTRLYRCDQERGGSERT